MKNITEHANTRYIERTSMEISRKKIIKYINNGGNIFYAKKLTNTRSLVYVPINKEIFKIIMNRKTKVIVSILPFNDIFFKKIKFHSKYYDNKTYSIYLFPDCYNETKDMFALTKIYKEIEFSSNLKHSIKLEYNHPYFKNLFDIAMELYNQIRGINEKEIENKIEKETIEFENEWKLINETNL